VQGIGLTISGLVHALVHEVGALVPVSVRVADGVCASLPCVLGPSGPSVPLSPPMTERERTAWERSIEILAEANASLPI
jgi:malate/lactate dehydrogenase